MKVPAYIVAQLVGAILASGTLRLVFRGKGDHFAGTVPAGSDMQAFVVEFLITFFLMFVISGVATDDRAVTFPVLIQMKKRKRLCYFGHACVLISF